MRTALALSGACLAAALAACDGDERSPTGERAERPPRDARPSGAPPPPDAGTRRGHGAEPALVAVPERDATPPAATVSLVLPDGRTAAEAARPGDAHEGFVELSQPRLRGTTTGVDDESGAARARVALSEVIACRMPDGALVERRRRRYFPPSQVERVRAAPGSRIPTRATRSVSLALGRCPAGAAAEGVEGELWGDVTNGLGLEAVTPHVRLRWRR